MATDPVPATSSPLIPMLVCRYVGAQLEFCTKVFDALEVSRRPGPDGNVVHALIRIGDAMVIIEREWPTLMRRAPQGDGSSPVSDRTASIVDLSGHVWLAASRGRDVGRAESTALVRHREEPGMKRAVP